MKSYFTQTLFFLLILLGIRVISQEQKPNKLIFTVQNQNNTTLDIPCYFFDLTSNKTIVSQTQNGSGEVQLYGNHSYYVYTRISSSYYPLQIPDISGMTFQQTFVFVDTVKQKYFTIPDSALVELTVFDYLKNPVSVQLNFRISKEEESIRSVRSDAAGKAFVYLPLGKQYSIDLPNAKNYSSVNIPNSYFYSVEKRIEYSGLLTGGKTPTETDGLISFRYVDIDKNPVAHEVITVTSKTTNRTFTDSTNSNGEAFILVPVGDSYTIATLVNKSVSTVTFAKDEKKAAFALVYRDLPTQTYLQRKKEWEQRAKEAEIEWKKNKELDDSVARVADKEWEELKRSIELQNEKVNAEIAAEEKAFKMVLDSIARQDSLVRLERQKELERIRIERLKEEERLKNIETIAKTESPKTEEEKPEEPIVTETIAAPVVVADPESLRRDSIAKTIWLAKYETRNNVWNNEPVVMRVMKRNPVLKPLIVVDATGSMEPYAKQLHNWFVLNFANNPTMNLVFFNDGDNLPDNLKKIGNTGGIHFCPECEILDAKKVMINTMRFNGGDIPENDIEALLTAVDSVKEFEQLILVADNLAPIRDYEQLVSKLDIPLKIIVCGVKNDIINEQLLNLAKATNGVICTMEQDYSMNLNFKEGDFVDIGKQRYYFLNGRFVRR